MPNPLSSIIVVKSNSSHSSSALILSLSLEVPSSSWHPSPLPFPSLLIVFVLHLSASVTFCQQPNIERDGRIGWGRAGREFERLIQHFKGSLGEEREGEGGKERRKEGDNGVPTASKKKKPEEKWWEGARDKQAWTVVMGGRVGQLMVCCNIFNY